MLKLHRESLRQMMQQGRVTRSHKIEVFQMLKPIVCEGFDDHGDIKELDSKICSQQFVHLILYRVGT